MLAKMNATDSIKMAGPFAIILGAIFIKNGWKWPSAAEQYRRSINRASGKHSVPASLLARMLYEESRFREDIISGKVTSKAGAVGIAQFMPATAKWLQVDPLDPHASIDKAAQYLATLKKRFGTWRLALIAYNWGEGNVSRNLANKTFAGESVQYADTIIKDAFP